MNNKLNEFKRIAAYCKSWALSATALKFSNALQTFKTGY